MRGGHRYHELIEAEHAPEIASKRAERVRGRLAVENSFIGSREQKNSPQE